VTRTAGRLRYQCQSVLLDPATDLIHIKGMTMPGQVKGLSPIAYARETIGLGLAAQRFGAGFFNNGALPGAVIETPGDMSQPAIDRFKASWNGQHGGVGNANKVGVLINGAKLSKVSVAPNDAQFLETRQFQVPDVARIFGVLEGPFVRTVQQSGWVMQAQPVQKGREIDVDRRQLELAGIDPAQVENVVDDGQQRLGRLDGTVDVEALLGVERRVAEQPGHADDAVHRFADLVAHDGEEAGARPARPLIPPLQPRQRPLLLITAGRTRAPAPRSLFRHALSPLDGMARRTRRNPKLI